MPSIVQRVNVIATMVSDGALKEVGKYRILDPDSFEFTSVLPDEYQARVAAEFYEIQNMGSNVVDDNGLVLVSFKKSVEEQNWSIEKSAMGEIILRHPKFDIVLV